MSQWIDEGDGLSGCDTTEGKCGKKKPHFCELIKYLESSCLVSEENKYMPAFELEAISFVLVTSEIIPRTLQEPSEY